VLFVWKACFAFYAPSSAHNLVQGPPLVLPCVFYNKRSLRRRSLTSNSALLFCEIAKALEVTIPPRLDTADKAIE
jgi:hypothetical protein